VGFSRAVTEGTIACTPPQSSRRSAAPTPARFCRSDTMIGNPYATSSLLDVTKNHPELRPPTPFSIWKCRIHNSMRRCAKRHPFRQRDIGPTLIMSRSNGTFTGTTSFSAVAQNNGFSGATVNCTCTYGKIPEKNVWIASTFGATIKHNAFLNSPADTITVQQGVVSSNYCPARDIRQERAATRIYVRDAFGPITNNFIMKRLNAGAIGVSHTTMRITDD
jgi:hypothetical protein